MSNAGANTKVFHPQNISFGNLLRSMIDVAVADASIMVRADYPLIFHKHSADPIDLGFNSRLHLYCSRDADNGAVINPTFGVGGGFGDTNHGYSAKSRQFFRFRLP